MSHCIPFIRRFSVPFRCFNIILFTLLIIIHNAQLCEIVAPLIRRFSVPFHRFSIILFYALSFRIHHAQIMLSFCIPIFTSFSEKPFRRFNIVLYTISITIHKAQIILSSCILDPPEASKFQCCLVIPFF